MLNKDKIRIMCRCAMYEKGQGKEDLAVNRYYQGDYVRLNTLKTVIGVTIGFVLCFGLYLVSRAEYYMKNIVGMNLVDFAGSILKYYIVVVVAFLIISVVFYSWKYKNTQKRIAQYYKDLERIQKMNDAGDEMSLAEDIKG